MTKALLIVVLGVAFVAAVGQHQQPYKGQQPRQVKALSEGDVEGLLEGRGMGLAKVAELNRYPGPMHVLDLKNELKLTAAQTKATEATMAAMRQKAKRLGREILDAEVQLDSQFSSGRADLTRVRLLARKIGSLQAELRLAHLEAHFAMKRLLSKEQVTRYARLRGY